jgi:NitT/TauT family transport system substrate-binding protein
MYDIEKQSGNVTGRGRFVKILRALLTAVLVISLVMVFGACGEKKLINVKLSEVTHSIFYAPQYAALNLGYFEEEGLSVELINGQGADKVMTAVLSGQADIGFSGPEAAIYVYNEGKEDYAVVFAQLTKRDGSFLVAREPDPDFKWNDVKGKYIIGGRKGGVPEMTLEYVLKKNGVIPGKDVEVDTSVQFALMAGAFTGGTGDYVTLFEPVASTLEREGKGYIVASVGAESGEIPYTLIMQRKLYEEKPGGHPEVHKCNIPRPDMGGYAFSGGSGRSYQGFVPGFRHGTADNSCQEIQGPGYMEQGPDHEEGIAGTAAGGNEGRR